MKAAEGMHVEWVDQEAVILDPESEKLHYLNATAALLFGLIAEFGYEEGSRQMRERFGAVEGFEEELKAAVEQMVEEGLLLDE